MTAEEKNNFEKEVKENFSSDNGENSDTKSHHFVNMPDPDKVELPSQHFLCTEILLDSSKYVSTESLDQSIVVEPCLDYMKGSDRCFMCNICKKNFMGSSNLTKHMRLHTRQRPFKCRFCQKAFIDSSNLTKHLRVHTGERPHKCEVCQRTFIDSSNLTKHIKSHSSEKFKCSVCEKKFLYVTHLTTHMKVHEGGTLYVCDICQKEYETEEELQRHTLLHRERPNKCTPCDQLFDTPSDLDSHIVSEHNSNGVNKCDVCGQQCATTRQFRKHFRIHNGKDPFKCSTCGEIFNKATDLKEHIVTHL